MKYFIRSLTQIIVLLISINYSMGQVSYAEKDSISVEEFINTIQNQSNYRVYLNLDWLTSESIALEKFEYDPVEAINYLAGKTGLKVVQYDRYNYLFINEFYISEKRNEVSQPPVNTGQAIEIGDSDKNPSRIKVNVTGIITDAVTGDPVIGATIMIKSTQEGTTSNTFGQFELVLPFGNEKLVVNSVGYLQDEFSIIALSDGSFKIELFEELKELEEVTITASAIDENVKGIQSGLNSMSIKGIKNIPTFMGEVDVIKSILLLPGVNNVGEGSSGFNVRGGETSQNLVLLDDMMIFNPSHLFGFFSAFQPDLISKIDLYKGGIPANYGGRLSSVLQVSTRDGNLDRIKGNISAGIVSSRATLEGPLKKNKGSFIMAARGSYVNWLLSKSRNIDLIKSNAGFGDYMVKVNYLVGQRNKLTLSTYNSWDNFKLASDTSYQIKNKGLNLKWDHIINQTSLISLALAQGQTVTQIKDESGFNGFFMSNAINYKKLKINYNQNQYTNHKLDAGLETIFYNIQPGNFKPDKNNKINTPIKLNEDISNESALYISDQITINEKLSVILGMRGSAHFKLGPSTYYHYGNMEQKDVNDITDSVKIGSRSVESSYFGLEPRVSARFSISTNASVKIGYNIINQYIHLISNTTTAVPTDYWLGSNYHIKPERAQQFSFGYFRNFDDNKIESSIEGFYKTMDNAIDYREGGNIILNKYVEADLLSGSGNSYGSEFMLKKKTGLLTGWISYTYSRSFRLMESDAPKFEINNGEFYPSNFDKPHDLSIVGQYSITKRVKLNWNFVYGSGRPVTAPDSKYQQLDVLSIKNYSERNQYRIPDYHRLDLGLVIEKNFKKNAQAKSSWAFSIYNLYARRNAYSVFFNDYGYAYRLSVLGTIFPALTYNITFE